jgi:hypothetical protein
MRQQRTCSCSRYYEEDLLLKGEGAVTSFQMASLE